MCHCESCGLLHYTGTEQCISSLITQLKRTPTHCLKMPFMEIIGEMSPSASVSTVGNYNCLVKILYFQNANVTVTEIVSF